VSVMSIEAAADILGYEVPESVLVHRMLQNIHPNVRSRLVFVSEPKSIKDFYSLVSQVAEDRAIDDRRKVYEHHAPTINFQQSKLKFRPVSMTVGETRQSLSRPIRCWKCSGNGHVDFCRYKSGKRWRRSAVRDLAEVRALESEQPRCRIYPVSVASLSPWVMLTIGDYCLPAILDTGSSFSFVRRDVFQQILSLGLPCRVETTNRNLHMASGQSCVIKEAVSLQIKLHSFSWKYIFLVLDNSPVPSTSILEADFLSLRHDRSFLSADEV
jgi:hypothetical protein